MHYFIPYHQIHLGFPQEWKLLYEVIWSFPSNARSWQQSMFLTSIASWTHNILLHMHTIMQVHHVLNVVLFQRWYIHHFEDDTPIISTIQSDPMIPCIMGLTIFLDVALMNGVNLLFNLSLLCQCSLHNLDYMKNIGMLQPLVKVPKVMLFIIISQTLLINNRLQNPIVSP